MTNEKCLLAIDLSVNVIFTTAVISFGIVLITRLKIRLNLSNRIKWGIALFSLVLRLGLTIQTYAKSNFNPTTVKYYFYWLLE